MMASSTSSPNARAWDRARACNLCLDLDRVEHMAKPTETKVRTRDGGG
jgi:hypothetical protein